MMRLLHAGARPAITTATRQAARGLHDRDENGHTNA
jgi:hypothetical protein